MENSTKRKLSKFTLKAIVTGVTGSVITKTLLNTIPATEKLNAAEIVGAVGGWYAGEKAEPHIDVVVDKYFDKREAQSQNTN